jgi:RNA polymerase sigma factor (TIGR02999 family)
MPSADVTRLLLELSGGNREAVDALVPIVYGELRRIAGGQLRREGRGNTLQATALVHEAYLQLIEQRQVTWQSRAHFFGVAAQAMRRILLDNAKARHRLKRGGAAVRTSLDQAMLATEDRTADVIAIDEALVRLEALDARQAKIVELRFYGGLSVDETAEVLGVSAPTVKRDWASARLWLAHHFGSGPSVGAADG